MKRVFHFLAAVLTCSIRIPLSFAIILGVLIPIRASTFAAPIVGELAVSSAKSEVVGNWRAKHPNWKGTIIIRDDGTFNREGGEGGKWHLYAEEEPKTLSLDWDSWTAEVLTVISPNLLRGKVRTGQFELERIAGATAPDATPAEGEQEWLPEFADPALKEKLIDSKWVFKDGRQLTLLPDGTTRGDWHDRKGYWRIVGPDKVQLTYTWRVLAPSIIAVEKEGKLLRWDDENWGVVAKRLEEGGELLPVKK